MHPPPDRAERARSNVAWRVPRRVGGPRHRRGQGNPGYTMTTACSARYPGSVCHRSHIALFCTHTLREKYDIPWQYAARSCDTRCLHSLHLASRGEKRADLDRSLFSPTLRPPGGGTPTPRAVPGRAAEPLGTRNPDALRLRCISRDTYKRIRRRRLGQRLFALGTHHGGRVHVASTVALYAPVRDASRMSIVHLQNVEIINSKARFSGRYPG